MSDVIVVRCVYNVDVSPGGEEGGKGISRILVCRGSFLMSGFEGRERVVVYVNGREGRV